MNILLIGNSYTSRNDLANLLKTLCRENGKDVTVRSVTQGGRKMIQYTNGEDPMTARLQETLQEGHYDAVFLQEQSLLPLLDFEAFLTGMQFVGHMVRSHTSSLIMYATWARKEGSPDLETYHWTPNSMARDLFEAYSRVARVLQAAVSPVGISFYHAIAAAPEIELYDPDRYHPSYLGSCLAALTHYCTLFGSFPEKTASMALGEKELAVFEAAVSMAAKRLPA